MLGLLITAALPVAANNDFLILISSAVDKTIYEGYGKTVTLSENLIVGRTYYIQTAGISGTSTCQTSHMINNQFILLTFTGVGQTAEVEGYCSPSATRATMTITNLNQLTTSVDYSFDVAIRKVVKLK